MKTSGKSPEETGPLQAQQGCSSAGPPAAFCQGIVGGQLWRRGGRLHKGALERLQVTLASPDWGAEGWDTSGTHQSGIQGRPRMPLGKEGHRTPIISKIRLAARAGPFTSRCHTNTEAFQVRNFILCQS